MSAKTPARKTPAELLADVVERREHAMLALQNLRQTWARAHKWNDQVSVLQQEVARSWTRFADFYDFVPMPFLVLDERLRILQANHAAVAFLVPARFVELPFVAFVSTDQSKAVVERLTQLRPDRMETLEVQLRARRGIVPVQLVVRMVRDLRAAAAAAAAAGIAGYPHPPTVTERFYNLAIMDLSEIRRLENERRRSSEAERAAVAAAKAKDEFIAMLSHELRTPLAPILNAAETLDGAGLVGGPLGEAVGAIRRNVLVEARLIDDLLDAARVTQKLLKVERRPLSLHELVGAVTRDWKPEHEGAPLELRLELEAGNDVVEGDEDRLAQVLRNVLINAAKFTPGGGSIVVRTENAGNCVRLSITDSGRGMGSDELARVFEPFQAGRPTTGGRAGLGLGLAISRGIVDAHHGRIRAASPGPDQGTRIEIELQVSSLPLERAEAKADAEPSATPAAIEPAAAAPAVVDAAAPDPAEDGADLRQGVRVLVVDDHQDSAETLALVLEMSGYEVTVAHSVREAEAQASGCDVLISDISLPDGSGLDLVRTLQDHRPLPAIALSGYGTEQDRQRSLQAGFAEHLTKPVYPRRLLEAVKRVSPPSPPPPSQA
jgi:signal transduction histidine kinase